VTRERVDVGLSVAGNGTSSQPPVLPAEVPQFFLPDDGESHEYEPMILGVADVSYASARYGVAEQRRVALVAALSDGPIALDWKEAERVDALDPAMLEISPRDNATFADVPRTASTPKNYPVWSKQLQQWVVAYEPVTLFSSAAMRLTSASGESERDFRIRLQVAGRELRDARVDKLRAKYATRLSTLREKLRKAEQAVERETAQAKQAGVDTVISVGSAVLGAIFGRGKVGVGSIGKVGTAARGVGRAAQQRGDVSRAAETVQTLRDQHAALEQELEQEIAAIGESYDAQSDVLDTVTIKAKSSDVRVQLVALLWVSRENGINHLRV
jgi:hypothetical protein